MKLAIIDFETTGLVPAEGGITEIGLVLIEKSHHQDAPTIATYSALEKYGSFNDPGMPIPEDIVELTGITDEMVKGQKPDLNTVAGILRSADLVVAHNASFDRAWLEHHIKLGFPLRWGCSKFHIDWLAHRIRCRHLRCLAFEHGVDPGNSHRAVDDCITLGRLLVQVGRKSARTYGEELIENALAPQHLVIANGAPFAAKDVLKQAGFRWAPQRRAWWNFVRAADMEKVHNLLCDAVYRVERDKGRPYGLETGVDALSPQLEETYGLK